MATQTTTATQVIKAEGASPQTGDVEVNLNYYLDPALGGHDAYYPNTASYHRRKFEPHTTKITDVRGKEDQFSLAEQGIEFHKLPTAEPDFLDEDRVKRDVYPETAKYMKELTGASWTHTVSHLTRRGNKDRAAAYVAALGGDGENYPHMTPALNVHIDCTGFGAEELWKDNYPDEWAKITPETRWGVYVMWRPIKPVERDPMSFCDARTAKDEELKPIRCVFPPKGSGQYGDASNGKYTESYYLKYNPEQKWYWQSGMQTDEVAVFKLYDSIRDGKTSWRVPHSAFNLPNTSHLPDRESIEIRVLCRWD